MVSKFFISILFLVFTNPLFAQKAQKIDKKELINFIDQKIVISSKSIECVKSSYTARDLENCLVDYFKHTKGLDAKNKGGYSEFKKMIMSGGGN